MKNIILLMLFGISNHIAAQQISIRVLDSKNGLPIYGAVIKIPSLKKTMLSDSTGTLVLKNLLHEKIGIECSAISYHNKEVLIDFSINKDSLIIELDPFTDELAGVVVSSTRSNRSFNNTPTRVELINDEEIHEEGEMRPGDIKMLLNESTGIQTQQTSATSGNASLRIQGLDGRYTQILRDGFPLYTGAATGLGILQTAPLDLRQVEIIKGAASTLYGGGAIAGLINLISKVPTKKKEMTIHLNGTSAGGLDLNGFYSERFKRTGFVLFASRNSNQAFDPSGNSFTAIPQIQRYSFNPKVFFYINEKSVLSFGINTVIEKRLGGDLNYIEGRGDSVHAYFEQNKTNRFSTQLTYEQHIADNGHLTIKNSVSFYNRDIQAPSYHFEGTQLSSFTEASYTKKYQKTDWVLGFNVLTDRFTEKPFANPILRNYLQQTVGIFAQNTWNISNKLIMETGLRSDYIIDYGFTLLPRFSTLFKISPKLSSRIGAGIGYKNPTIFTEETETLLFKKVLPINPNLNKLENSYGFNGDLNYKTNFGLINLNINQLFFYTIIKNPLILFYENGGYYRLMNANTNMNTIGTETNCKLSLHELALYLGYTITDTKNPLTPKHRLNSALVYEIEGKWKFGSEFYYFSNQTRTDGSIGRSYSLVGLLVEKVAKKFSIYANFENMADIRQTKFESIYTGTITNPVFKDIYAPLDGFVMNAGIKLKLY